MHSFLQKGCLAITAGCITISLLSLMFSAMPPQESSWSSMSGPDVDPRVLLFFVSAMLVVMGQYEIRRAGWPLRPFVPAFLMGCTFVTEVVLMNSPLPIACMCLAAVVVGGILLSFPRGDLIRTVPRRR